MAGGGVDVFGGGAALLDGGGIVGVDDIGP
jgi:hypothetical protein